MLLLLFFSPLHRGANITSHDAGDFSRKHQRRLQMVSGADWTHMCYFISNRHNGYFLYVGHRINYKSSVMWANIHNVISMDLCFVPPGASTRMRLLISYLPLPAPLWKGRSSENSLGDLYLAICPLLSGMSDGREAQRQKRFHFKALSPGLQTPLLHSWMSTADASRPESQNRTRTLPKDKKPSLSSPWSTLQHSLVLSHMCSQAQCSQRKKYALHLLVASRSFQLLYWALGTDSHTDPIWSASTVTTSKKHWKFR